MDKIKVGIVGYGNLGRGVQEAIKHNDDMELVAIFTRRDVNTINSQGARVQHIDNIKDYINKIDVCVLCGGSATDILSQAPYVATMFNTVDSFDTHAKINQYFYNIDEIAKENKKVSMISTGWDPGVFSLMRVFFESILPSGQNYTFWGKGISQGHSDAIRRIENVVDAKQYTIPIDSVIEDIKQGKNPTITTTNSHKRYCYVAVKEGADKEDIENKIKNMPNYFQNYDTVVEFVSKEELEKNHSKLPHAGRVLRYGSTSDMNNEFLDFSLNLDSNPEFTASVNIACVRAVHRLSKEGKTGAYTILDIPISYFSLNSSNYLRQHYL